MSSSDDFSSYFSRESLKDYWDKSRPLLWKGAVFVMASQVINEVAYRVFDSSYDSRVKGVFKTAGEIFTIRPCLSFPYLTFGALTVACIFASIYPFKKDEAVEPVQPPVIKSSPRIVLLDSKAQIEEYHRTQLTQLVAGIGGLVRPHAVVVGADPGELENLIQQLPLFPHLNGWQILRWNIVVKGEAFLKEWNEVIAYLNKNPKTIFYLPSMFLPSAVLDRLPSETYVVARASNIKIWDSAESTTVYKEIKLQPLSHSECKAAITEWASCIKKTFEEHSLDAAIELAFLIFEESGDELSFTKDLIERASKITTNPSISIANLWEVFVTMYPLINERKDSLSGSNALEEISPGKSLDEIAQIMRKKFNLTLTIKEKNPLEPPGFLIDLNEKMKDRDPLAVGNERRIAELTQGLKGLDKTNALLIGTPGVGKTTLVESIAWMIAHNTVEEKSPFYGKTIYSLDLNNMMIGTQWVGRTNERVAALFRFLAQAKDAILFIDEIQQTLGAGTSSNNEMGSIAQLMKPYLLAYGITVIGATTPGEYSKWMATDTAAAFGRRFREVKISDPTEDECVLMLTHLTESDRFAEAYPGVRFEEGSIKRAIQLMSQVSSRIGDPDRTKDFIEKVAGKMSSIENKVITPQVFEQYFKTFHQLNAGTAAS